MPKGTTDDDQEYVQLEGQDNLPALGEQYELHTPVDFTDYREPVTVSGLRQRYLVNVVAIIEPPDFKVPSPGPDIQVRSDIDLVVCGKKKDVTRMAEDEGMLLKENVDVFKDDVSENTSGTVEAVVAPRSSWWAKPSIKQTCKTSFE